MTMPSRSHLALRGVGNTVQRGGGGRGGRGVGEYCTGGGGGRGEWGRGGGNSTGGSSDISLCGREAETGEKGGWNRKQDRLDK
jgi:hypothetical protein